jgi:hypothetical protein
MNTTPKLTKQTVRVSLRISTQSKRWEFFWGACRALWSGRVTVEYEINPQTKTTTSTVVDQDEKMDRAFDQFDRAFAAVDDVFKRDGGFPRRTRSSSTKESK